MARAGERTCLSCKLPLSRYNTEALCARCQRDACDPGGACAGTEPAWLWDSELMRAALARADVAAVVALFRAASGLSQEELGHLLCWSQATVSLIESGRRHSLYDIRRFLRFVDEIGMPRAALAPLILGDPDAAFHSVVQGGGSVDLDRRGFHALAAGLVAATVLPPPARVDHAHVRFLQEALARLRSQDRTVGGARLLRHQAVQLFHRAKAMLDESDYAAEVGRKLLVVTADLGIVAAWLAYDSGDQRRAHALYSEAELLAGSADDPEVAIHVYANMAQQATFLARVTGRRGTAREALRFADRAADYARHMPSPALQALIALRQALAHARLGDEVAFAAAINRARRNLDREPCGPEPAWAAFVGHSEITGYEGMGRAQLGQPERAAPLFRTVLQDSSRSPRDLAYYRARLAEAMCAAGDHHGAVREGLAVLPGLGHRLGSARVLHELRPVRQVAAEGADAERFAAEFDIAAQALSAAS